MTLPQIKSSKIFEIFEDYVIQGYKMTKKDIVQWYLDQAFENNQKRKYELSLRYLKAADIINSNNILRDESDKKDYGQ